MQGGLAPFFESRYADPQNGGQAKRWEIGPVIGGRIKSPKEFVSALKTLVGDLQASVMFGADARSRCRLGVDLVLSRLVRLVPTEWRNRVREVRLRDDVKILYRLNKGDLHSIREVWFQNAYWLPFDVPSGVLLDLGANIGMASVWLAKRYGLTRVISVEPDPDNAVLLARNLKLNGIAHEVVQAAVGAKDGTSRFQFSEFSNLGRLSENGSLVSLISVGTIMKKFGLTDFSLIKIDIEGGEEDLFNNDAGWLVPTHAIIIEFHSNVDCRRIVSLMSSEGFRYIPAHTLFPDNLPCFTRGVSVFTAKTERSVPTQRR